MHLNTSEIKGELFKETFLLAIYFQCMAWLDLSFRNFTAAHILVPYSLSIFIVIDCIKVSYSAREGFCSFVSWFKTITLQNQDSFWCGNISGKLQSSLYYTVLTPRIYLYCLLSHFVSGFFPMVSVKGTTL